jgi:RHS repeat-associated protein
MLKMLRAAIYAMIVFLLVSVVARGQVATGIYNYGTYDTLGLDTVNVGNLNVHLNLPVINKAGRGLSFYYALSYDSSVWYPGTSSGLKAWTPVQNFGWNGQTNGPLGYLTYQSFTGQCQTDSGREEIYHYRTGYVYVDAFGVSHSYPITVLIGVDGNGCSGITPGAQTAIAADGSGYSIYVLQQTNTITTASNKKITPPVAGAAAAGSIQDLNGNEISLSSGTFEDTTGTTALTVAGGAPNPLTLTYKDTSGNSQSVTVTYVTETVHTNFGCSGVTEYGPTSTSLVSSITYPDGSIYTFTYEPTPGASGNVTGRVASIGLPQGGSIVYTYTGNNNGIECSDGSAAGLTRTLNSDSGSAASVWTYTRPSVTQTQVVDGLSNHKVYNFVEVSNQGGSSTLNYYETTRALYQGAVTNPPVLSRTTCYNTAAPQAPCTSWSFSLPLTEVDAYETLNGSETHGWTTTYNSYGVALGSYVYDYASGSSRGSLLRSELWTYGYTVPNLPTQDAVYDGSGNLAGKTTYTYDGATPTASSGVPQHVSVTGARGNLTSASVYASSGTSYPLSWTYEDTGNVLTSTTPNGKTTLSWDPTFVYNTGSALPTPSSGVAIGTSEFFDTTNTGLPLTATDPNTQITQIPSYDSMLRPTEVEFPDGGKTTWAYTPTTLTANTYQTSSVYSDTEIQLDGYARQSRSVVANGQSTNPWYQSDTCYDGNGNVGFASYRYQGAGLSATKVCSGSGDTYTYDVLGRFTNMTRQNGESYGYKYVGRATQSTDANGVIRISQIDGLGRPTYVCEVSSSTLQGVAPTACGLDISGTGFLTTYSYALATATTTVTQGSTQTRTFKADWLGRPTSVTEPESGITTYSYAYNTTGLAVTRVRPKANQTSVSVTTTTTTQYDSLNRVISITYTDGTPTKSFTYDASAGTGWSDLTQINLKGRLSIGKISGGGSSAFSYDPVGRISYLDECFPSTCGTVADNHLQNYTYDLAGNLLSSTDGANVTSTYTVSLANEPLSLTSSLTNSTNPAHILSSVNNGPDGPTSYALGNGLSGVYSFDTLGRINGGWICNGSISANCSGGSQTYGFTDSWSGAQLKSSVDSVLAQTANYGYDGFNRLTSRTISIGTTQNFTYVYDRYGNRWQQNVTSGSGPQPQLSFNAANNQITTSGYAYDAAGNMTDDSAHTYTYDAEGNIIAVDSGSTAQYTYNAFNQRVQTVTSSGTTEFVFNANGQRVSTWNGTTNAQIQGEYYWGSKPVAFYKNGQAHFQHQDWLGTERMRTTYTGSVEGSFSSLPFGDLQATASGTDLDPYHYASLDYDTETTTDHAQYRQYNSTQGRWMRPEPYSGSYDFSNPQSMNRYAYVMNNPLASIDPSGLDGDGNVPCPPVQSARPGMPHAFDDDPCTTDPLNPEPGPPETPAPPPPCDGDICVYSGPIDDVPEDLDLLLFYYYWYGGGAGASNGCSSALAAANRSAAGVARANAAWSVLQTAAGANAIPTALLAAIAVRESNFMNVQETLQGGGMGPGMGVFQLTNQPGVSAAQAFNLPFAANYAAGMLSSNMNNLSSAFSFTPAQLVQATAASYNFGTGNISGNPNTIDVGTTGGNYGSTVVGMMACFSHP